MREDEILNKIKNWNKVIKFEILIIFMNLFINIIYSKFSFKCRKIIFSITF